MCGAECHVVKVQVPIYNIKHVFLNTSLKLKILRILQYIYNFIDAYPYSLKFRS